MFGSPPAQALRLAEERGMMDARRERSAGQLTFLQAEKELKATQAELERQQILADVPSAIIGARASAQRLREENERAQREAMRTQSAERLLYIEAEKKLKAAAAQREKEEMLKEYSLATQHRKALEAASRPGTPPRSVLVGRSPHRKLRTSSPRRVQDPSSPSIFERLSAEQKAHAHRKPEDLLDARDAAELRDKPQLSPASRRMMKRNPPQGDLLARLASPTRTGPKYESPRRSDELESPRFDSFKAKPMPNYDKIHMMSTVTHNDTDVPQYAHSPGRAVEGVQGSSVMRPGEMDHLRRQLAAVRNRGLDESTQELVEGLLASIDAKTVDSEQEGLQRPGRSRSPAPQSQRRSGGKRVSRKNKKVRQNRDLWQYKVDADETWEPKDDDDDDDNAELSSAWETEADEKSVDTADDSSRAEAEPLTPRSLYASLSAEKVSASGRLSPSAPFPPMEMSEQTAKIICHSAKFVALHGPRFFDTLHSKHKDAPLDSPWAWISDPASSDSKFFFAQRLEYEQEMVRQQAEMSDGPAEAASEEPAALELEPQPRASSAHLDGEIEPAHKPQPSDNPQSVAQLKPTASAENELRPPVFMPANPDKAPWIRPVRTTAVHTSRSLPWVHIGYVEKDQPVRLLEMGFDDDGGRRVRIGDNCWCSAEHSDGSLAFESCNGPSDIMSLPSIATPVLEQTTPSSQRSLSGRHNGSIDSGNDIGESAKAAEAGEDDSVSISRQRAFDAWTRVYEEGMQFDEKAHGEQLFSGSPMQSPSRRRQATSTSASRKLRRKRGSRSTGINPKGTTRTRSLRQPAATKASAGRKQAMADRSRAAQEQAERDRRALERRRERTNKLAKTGDARRVAAIAEAKKARELQIKQDQEQQQHENRGAAAAVKSKEGEAELQAEQEERAATKAAAADELALIKREEEERKRQEEEEAKLSDADRAVLARAREEELQRQLSEAEAARIMAKELARRRDWLQQVPIFEPILADEEGVSFLNAVAEKLEVQTVGRNEFVVKKGDIGAEM